MSTPEEKRRDEVRMEYLLELVAVQGEGLAKNLRELADIGERHHTIRGERRTGTAHYLRGRIPRRL